MFSTTTASSSSLAETTRPLRTTSTISASSLPTTTSSRHHTGESLLLISSVENGRLHSKNSTPSGTPLTLVPLLSSHHPQEPVPAHLLPRKVPSFSSTPVAGFCTGLSSSTLTTSKAALCYSRPSSHPLTSTQSKRAAPGSCVTSPPLPSSLAKPHPPLAPVVLPARFGTLSRRS
jgi:hypothetical protein